MIRLFLADVQELSNTLAAATAMAAAILHGMPIPGELITIGLLARVSGR
jgi:hypothetical protein